MTLEEQWAEMAQRQDREKLESYRQLNRLAKKGQAVFTGSSLMEQFPLNEMLQGEAGVVCLSTLLSVVTMPLLLLWL